ncbi:CarD family transcriptional regulator [Romboutsia lituseburensis]|uniref:Transcriptional regulator, CarD family n=1 Tax=Romboutsia lituseburensis DSM 797 TaxID=1121325 RepID=A0A1G9J5Q6_9FIRM|nr:CarD family transcriptional regulator [Romboutsia lituseburensis]CEH33620.1 CarD transcriptional regulator [Romboutsia lituseburensis]SDL32868.1 transcriptional regulator, CarD family [Romboutsia lituseburensis DSM 797]
MFNVNDYVMYGMTGVCKIIDITNEKFINNMKKEYYVLTPVYSENTTIKIPVDNVKIPMRRVLSKEEAISIINDIPNNNILWEEDEKIRKAQFQEMLKSGDCNELIKLIRCIYLNKEYLQSIGKKTYQVDLDFMKDAERLLNEEFAISLNISPDDVYSYITNNMPK